MKLSAKTKQVFYGRPGETGESAAGSHIQPLNCSGRSVRQGENVRVPIIMHFRSNSAVASRRGGRGKGGTRRSAEARFSLQLRSAL